MGLGAGFDKSGGHLQILEKLGFGYLVAGTVTLHPWLGHPGPRFVRDPEIKSMINALGFPNPGVDCFIRNLKRQRVKVPMIGSVSGRDLKSIAECYSTPQPHTAGIELNLSSPNTTQLKDIRKLDSFRKLVSSSLSLKRKPTYLKMPTYISEDQYSEVLELAGVWPDLGFDGVAAANTIRVVEPRLSMGSGGLSGPSLLTGLIKGIVAIRKIVPKEFEINTIGGVSSAGDVRAATREEASTVQVFTSVVFEGSGLARKIVRDAAQEGCD